MEDLRDSLEKLGGQVGWWRSYIESHHTSLGEVGYIVRGCAWSEMKKVWMMEAEGSSKLGMMKNLMEGRYRARCVQVVRK